MSKKLGAALECVKTLGEFTTAALAPWAIGYLVATRAPKAKPAPTRKDA